MATHTIKGFITYERYHWEKEGRISFQTWKPGPEHEAQKVVVAEHEFDFEVPDDFNPIPQQVAALEEQKRKARVKLAQDLARIDEQISKLTCIEHTVADA
jgi:hypothetical protein